MLHNPIKRQGEEVAWWMRNEDYVTVYKRFEFFVKPNINLYM